MPKITEVNDKKSESVPSVAEMRESQRKGGEGLGTHDCDFNCDMQQTDQGVDVKN
jgi:hypothetical protein